MAIGKNAVKVPNRIPYNRDGKDDTIKYIREFDILNALKSVEYTLGKKK